MPRTGPQVAQVEDCDSDNSSGKPETRREARRKTATSRPPKAIDRYRSAQRDIASDSGYSSHTSATQASNVSTTAPPVPVMQALPYRPAATPAPAQSSAKPRPVVHRSESQRSRERPPSRSGSTSGRRESCSDLNCQHASCQSIRMAERRHSGTFQYNTPYAPQHAPQHSQPAQQMRQEPAQQYQYQYAQVQQLPNYQMAPPAALETRPRPQMAARLARPASIHGYPYPNPGSQGPPPSLSAYQNAEYAARVHAYQQQQAYQRALNYPAPPLVLQSQPNYPPPSPVGPSPTSPDFRTGPGFQSAYTTRSANTTTETAAQQFPSASSMRTYSTRQGPARQSTMPGSYLREESESSDSYYSSSSEDSDDDRDRHYRPRARDARILSQPTSRRPSLKRQHATAPLVPTRNQPRDLLRRNTRTDPALEYVSSSDAMDSDRTARAVIDQPRNRSYTATSSTRSSRRPSVSTTASSGRTKATTVSSMSGLANVIVERNGRHISYLSKRDQDRIEAERRRGSTSNSSGRDYTANTTAAMESEARAYQDQMRGAQAPPNLTAQDIREHEAEQQHAQPQQAQRRQESRSRVSASAHSRKDSRSSIRTHDSEAIKIVGGGNVVHLPPNTTIEMHTREDGSLTWFIDPSGVGAREGKRRFSVVGSGSNIGSRFEGTRREDEDDDDDGRPRV